MSDDPGIHQHATVKKWEQMSVEEKVDDLRGRLESLLKMWNLQHEQIQRLMDHRHVDSGHPVIAIRER